MNDRPTSNQPASSLLSKSIPEPSLPELLSAVLFVFALWLLCIAFGIFGFRAHAETLPSTSNILVAPLVSQQKAIQLKVERSLHAADYVRFGGIAAYRALDWKTTTTALRLGSHEAILPQSIAGSPGRLAAFEVGASVGQMAGSTFLIHHGHRKLAQSIDWLSIGGGVLTVSWNEHVIHEREAATSKLIEVGK